MKLTTQSALIYRSINNLVRTFCTKPLEIGDSLVIIVDIAADTNNYLSESKVNLTTLRSIYFDPSCKSITRKEYNTKKLEYIYSFFYCQTYTISFPICRWRDCFTPMRQFDVSQIKRLY